MAYWIPSSQAEFDEFQTALGERYGCDQIRLAPAWCMLVDRALSDLEDLAKSVGQPLPVLAVQDVYGWLLIDLDVDRLRETVAFPRMCYVASDARELSMQICAVCGSPATHLAPPLGWHVCEDHLDRRPREAPWPFRS